MGDFNTPLLPVDRESKQQINRKRQALNDTLDQLELIDIYREFHSKAIDFTFFLFSSSAHGALSMIGHMLGYKSSSGNFFCPLMIHFKHIFFTISEVMSQSCLTLCNHMDCSLPASSIHRIFQARVL